MSKPKIVITRRWPQEVEDILVKEFDTTLNENDLPMTVSELHVALQTADAVCPTVSDKIDAEVLGAAKMKSTLLASNGVGFNHIDLDAAKAAGLTVTNTPDVLTDCTADLAMTLMLMVARRAGEGERHVRGNRWTGWRPTHMMGTSVTGKTMGFIGMGRIAQATAKRAANGFGMNIIFYNPSPRAASDLSGFTATQCDSIDEVFAKADFISLHCPGGEATHHLINADAFNKMQDGAFIINTARGDVIEEQALIDALKSGKIKGAGLDVYEFEPKVADELMNMENVVLLPHLGSATNETRVAMGMRVIDNLRAYFAGNTPGDKVV